MWTIHRLWFDLCIAGVETAQATTITLTHRVPRLAETSLWPNPDGLLEAHRMVAEKLVAIVEGTTEAMAQGNSLMMRAALGDVRPDEWASVPLTLSIAATEPTRRHARANARRLSQPADRMSAPSARSAGTARARW